MNIHEVVSVCYSQELVDHMDRTPAKFGYIKNGRSNIHCCEVHVACARESSRIRTGVGEKVIVYLSF